jgi:hypothetical protein
VIEFTEDDAPAPQPENDEGQDQPPFTALRALVGTLFHPRATFQRMREAKRGHWWVVLFITLAAVTLFIVMRTNVQTARRAEMLAQMEAAGETGSSTAQAQGGGPGGGGPPGGGMAGPGMGMMLGGGGGGGSSSADSAAGAMGGTSLALSLGTGVLGVVVGYFARGLLLFLLSLALGGQATFKQIFRAGVWATLPLAVRNLVQGMVVVITGAIPISGLSGVFGGGAPGGSSVLLSGLLSEIDIYTVWSLILIAAAVTATAKLSRLKGAVASLLSWLIMVGATLGASALAGSLLGGG